MYARFEDFRTFLCVFMSVFRVFVRKKIMGKGKLTGRNLFQYSGFKRGANKVNYHNFK